MSDKTKIEWTDATWNPIRGCTRVSEGCRNCYAETVAKRFSGEGMPYHGLIAKTGQWNGNIHVIESVMTRPLRWQRPRRIFVNSMSDLFHENLDIHQIARIFAVMQLSHWHTFQILTKRPDRMLSIIMDNNFYDMILTAADEFRQKHPKINVGISSPKITPAPNIWLGVSIEDQATADERIPLLLQTPSAVRWVSAEPLLGPIKLCFAEATHSGDACEVTKKSRNLDWVVAGGESGKRARPIYSEWAQLLRDQCIAARVPFYFKQWGEWLPDSQNKSMSGTCGASQAIRVGKKTSGRLLDGLEWAEFPPSRH